MTLPAVTHATGIGPLPALLEERAGQSALVSVFSDAGLPLALIENKTELVPMPQLARLYQLSAERVGDPLFGLAVGTAMAPDDYGMWVRYAMQAPKLGEGIRRVVRTLHLHQTGAAMGLSARSEGLVAWEYWHRDIADPGFRQHSDRLLRVMMRFIQGFIGPDWTPVRIELAYGASRRLGRHEDATQTDWLCNQPKAAIVMQSTDLQSPGPQRARSSSPLLGYADVVAQAKLGSMDSQVASIGATISLRLLEGADDINGAAKALGLSTRTLQRRLDAHGLSYRSLLSRLRMQRAKSLVEETDTPLKQIGLQLDYSDPAHFTRAFKKHFGYAPCSLRR